MKFGVGSCLLGAIGIAAIAVIGTGQADASPVASACRVLIDTGIEPVLNTTFNLIGFSHQLSSPLAPQACDWKGQSFPSPNPNEGLKEAPSNDPHCPAGSVRVADFCMDRFLGSLEEVQDDGSAVAWSPFHNPTHPGNFLGSQKQVLPVAKKIRAISARGAIPQGHISEKEAALACANHFPTPKRLCSAKEWLRACQGPGPDPRLFPYGGKTEADRKPGACNDFPRKLAQGEKARIAPLAELFYKVKKQGDDLPDTPYTTFMDNSCVTQRSDTVSRGGDFPDCVTEDGVYDLVGNLHEWTSEMQPSGKGVFRGGYFMDTYLNGPGCQYATTRHGPEHYDYSTGFRCCADPAN